MSNYWAKFKEIKGNTFRYDTRIYLKKINKPSDEDICIGAVVGKNPGSAIPAENITDNLQSINLDGDQLLPNVKSIFTKAYKVANKTIGTNTYIQVLNLMYICDKDLISAISKISEYDKIVNCEKEQKNYPFVWYVWGNSDKNLNKFKSRFSEIKADKHFYLHTKDKRIFVNIPSIDDPARHTQGLPHDLVVPFISTLV
ncbi:hypothetical protein [Clostridium beijerinckii]|uniref:DUF1643 domain-containing protein n=1 Tax=Clostridium beijerinckii TaxID=1520 RepID=A0A1S9N720_CLOBE|nr:hypothetical protein [Clostridium beijerinckii]OOP73200.1 hypothetical protein CBEIBR21_09190 [Clostridium beijerinckii]